MARRQVGLQRQTLINELYEKVEKKAERQEKRHSGLTEDFLADRFGKAIFEKPNFATMTSKQAKEYIQNANDYLSRKGNISTLSSDGYGWSTDVRKLKDSLKEHNVGDIMKEAFKEDRKRETFMHKGKVVTIKVKNKINVTSDPGVVPVTYEIGNKTYGYQSQDPHARLVIKSQEKLEKAIARQKRRKELFTMDKIQNAKKNYLKTLASAMGLDYTADSETLMQNPTYASIANKLSEYSNAQFYYMYKTSSVFDYNFWYSTEELSQWVDTFLSETKLYDNRFEKGTKGYKHYIETLEENGIDTDA